MMGRPYAIIAMIALSLAFSVVVGAVEEEKLGRDDFVSTTISAVFDKVGQYTSGEKGILLKEEKTGDRDRYSTDALGRPMPEQVIKTKPSPDKTEKKPSVVDPV